MADSFDDGIELLKNDVSDVINLRDCQDDLVSGTTPISLLTRGCSVDESITEARQHALKTAFEALQKKHNKQTQKYMDLVSRNRVLERQISNSKHSTKPTGYPLNMEEFNEVHAAGGTSEEEEAVSRANQGYMQHLNRELLITKNKLDKCMEENVLLKDKLAEKEYDLLLLGKERERVHGNLEFMKDSFDLRKDTDVKMIREQLITANKTNEQFEQELESLRHSLATSEHNNQTKDEEMNNCKSCLATARNELKKITMQYRDLQKDVEGLDKENSAIKARCKQYEIEVEISRKQKQDQLEDSDDVDGDVAALTQALCILSSEREEIRCLKEQVVEQSKKILQIQQHEKIMHLRSKSLSTPSTHYRHEPMGAMSAPTYEDNNFRPQGKVLSNVQRFSPVSGNDFSQNEYNTGRKVNDSIQPTGNRNITPMYAMESSPHVRRKETLFPGSVNTFAQNIGLQDSSNQNTDVRTNASVTLNRRHSNSPRSELSNASGYGTSFANLSQHKNRTPSPASDHRHSPSSAMNTSPRVPNIQHNYMNMENNDFNLPKSPSNLMPKFPLRMTQSEVVLRNSNVVQEVGNDMSRSTYEVHQQANYTEPVAQKSQNVFGELDIGQMNIGRPYLNQFREVEEHRVPDYENVYVGNHNASRKQPMEHETEDNTFIKHDTRVIDNATALPESCTEQVDQVSVLNICPSCNREFSRLTLDQFQVHVVNCFDSADEQPATLQATGNEDDRTCPMCGAGFPLTIAQDTYEQHVLSHFQEDGNERFEMLQ